MRRPSIYTQRRGPLDVKMTPMIDVVFLLLVFFVWTASFQVVEYALRSSVSDATGAADLPAPPPEELDFDNVVVRIVYAAGQPQWRLNDESLASLPQLRGRLTAIFRTHRQAPVIIHPDAATPLEHVVAVFDVSQLIGFEKIRLAAAPDAPGE